MEPGLVKNDRILVQKVSYWFGGSPQRGDVVVFRTPATGWAPWSRPVPRWPHEADGDHRALPSGGHLVKRVIGVAGDTIECCDEQGRISVNGKPLDEDSYVKQTGADCNGPMIGCNWTAGPVPEGALFVMGDNRAHSADSTVHLCTKSATDCVAGDEYVSTDLVVGKVFVLLWPSDRFKFVHRPDTFATCPIPPRADLTSVLPRGSTVRRDAGLYGYERALRRHGIEPIAGVDEAGRGARAGPLVAGAAILPPGKAGIIPGLADSVLLTEKARERCYEHVLQRALAWSVVGLRRRVRPARDARGQRGAAARGGAPGPAAVVRPDRRVPWSTAWGSLGWRSGETGSRPASRPPR